ncbi:hypothetical protein BGZ59_010293 [Podila verticillata]|nr:hypothetical protein BGZ59_010293 [Podila verticillata]
MKFTAFTAIVLATIALAASSAEALTCYQRCLKEGESAAVYRRCVREGESASYCKKSCRN